MTNLDKTKEIDDFTIWYLNQKEMNPYIMRDYWLERMALHEQKVKESIILQIEENINIEKMTHRIGSHSDDYGGESDFPCTCDNEKRKHSIDALESLKIKIARGETI